MNKEFIDNLSEKLEDVKGAGLYKSERVITSQQSGKISVSPGDNVLNFCANNYLGLADNEELIRKGKNALDEKGYGMAIPYPFSSSAFFPFLISSSLSASPR